MSDVANDPTEEQKADLSQMQRQAFLHQGSDFEPNRDLKETWLPLRKTSPRKWGGIEYPGLFDYRVGRDTGTFYFTVSLEIISAAFIVWLMFMSNMVGMGLAISAVLLNLIVDGVLAYLHHLSERDLCIKKNRECRFLPEAWKNGINSYSQHALSVESAFKSSLKVWFWKPFSTVSIWGYALLKILFFLFLFLNSDFYYEMVEEQNAGLFAIAIAALAVGSYIWIAINHTYFTGYYLAYRWHSGQYNRAFSEYIKAVGMGAGLGNNKAEEIKKRYQAQQRTKSIDLNNFCRSILQLDVPEFRHFQQSGKESEMVKECLSKGLVEKKIDGLHNLVRVQGQENTWILICHGLLKDEQLDEIVKDQPTDFARLAVAYYGHSIQMESVNL